MRGALVLWSAVQLAAGAGHCDINQRSEILYWHNKARSHIAQQGTCANMLEMSWNTGIADATETNVCPSSHNGQSAAAYGQSLGENLAWGGGTCMPGLCSEAGICNGGSIPCAPNCNSYCTLKSAIYNGWYQSETVNPSGTTDPCLSYNDGGGHCSQMVWQSSWEIGCTYQQGCANWDTTLACSYKAPGNYLGSNAGTTGYNPDCTSGAACSNCPASHPYCTSGANPGLCSQSASCTGNAQCTDPPTCFGAGTCSQGSCTYTTPLAAGTTCGGGGGECDATGTCQFMCFDAGCAACSTKTIGGCDACSSNTMSLQDGCCSTGCFELGNAGTSTGQYVQAGLSNDKPYYHSTATGRYLSYLTYSNWGWSVCSGIGSGTCYSISDDMSADVGTTSPWSNGATVTACANDCGGGCNSPPECYTGTGTCNSCGCVYAVDVGAACTGGTCDSTGYCVSGGAPPPTASPTKAPTSAPTTVPPTAAPTRAPSVPPTKEPTNTPAPSAAPGCASLSAPVGGTISGSCVNPSHLESCSTTCDHGRISTGSTTRQCQSGTWSGAAFECSLRPCTTLTSPPNAQTATCDNKVHGDTCMFTCNTGYTPASSTRTCENGVWEGSVLTCSPKPCATLNSPAGAAAKSCFGSVHGDVCTFACNSGYTVAGDVSRTCTDGSWTGTQLTCTQPNSCVTLTAPSGSASTACSDAIDGDDCTFACSPGYTGTGDTTRTCSSAGTWGGTPLVCDPQACPTLDSPPGADQKSCAGMVQGESCTFECSLGYEANNGLYGTRQCDQQVWVGTELECTIKTCPVIAEAAHAFASDTCANAVHESRCNQICDAGWYPKEWGVTCNDGAWAPFTALTCQQYICPTLVAPAGGSGTTCESKVELDTCVFTCDANTVAEGDLTRECRDGQWLGTAPTCTAVGECPTLSSPSGANSASCTKIVVGGDCQFSCKQGYTATGSSYRTCEAGANTGDPGTWSGSAFGCDPVSCPALPPPANAADNDLCSSPVHGDTCTHECAVGYLAVGDVTRECVDGLWDGQVMSCIRKTCDGLAAPVNSTQYGNACDDYKHGDVCVFECLPDMVVAGSPSRECRDGVWTGNVLLCVPPEVRYKFQTSGWGPCSTTCGPGVQQRDVWCVDMQDPQRPIVSSDLCVDAGEHPAPAIEECPATQPCPSYSWTFDAWSECTHPCGGQGLRSRTVVCTSTTNGVGSTVADSHCATAVGVKPAEEESCNPQTCGDGFLWASTLWSKCSVPCGGGTASRTLECQDQYFNTVPDSSCGSTKPDTSRPCNQQECIDYGWNVCDWEPCTAQCGGSGQGIGMVGVLYRSVFCNRMNDSVMVDESLCSGDKPSSSVLGCNGHDCEAPNWMTAAWSSCENGLRNRTTHCHDSDGSNAADEVCDPDKIPHLVESCTSYACPVGAALVAEPTPGPLIQLPAVVEDNLMYIGIGIGAFVLLLVGGVAAFFLIRKHRNDNLATEAARKIEMNENLDVDDDGTNGDWRANPAAGVNLNSASPPASAEGMAPVRPQMPPARPQGPGMPPPRLRDPPHYRPVRTKEAGESAA